MVTNVRRGDRAHRTVRVRPGHPRGHREPGAEPWLVVLTDRPDDNLARRSCPT